ncbi:MAG TPA: polyprenyl diphosphate synthase [Candidatus Nanoarchaeia archaeon]|nr:polyprenyl diphosphate synthase [Candidatus Nanoarchaeia archaeon]
MEEEITYSKFPQHIAVNMRGTETWAEKTGATIEEAYSRRFEKVKEIITAQTNLKIPILTLYVLPNEFLSKENAQFLLDSLSDFLNSLKGAELIHNKGIKVSILGKWYDLPGRIVDSIKQIIEETKDYDKFFVNFCVNYDGQDEILDACRLIARKIKAGKFDPEMIEKETIKEETYSSYFLPPQLIISTGPRTKLKGLLLWDSSDAIIHFSKKNWPEFTREDFVESVAYYQKQSGM